RLDEVVADEFHRRRMRIDAVDILPPDLGGAAAPELRLVAPIGGVGEPDRPVGFDHDVVRAVETLALIAVGDDGDGPVVLGPRYGAPAALAAEQAPFPIDGGAVGIPAGLAEDTNV